MRKVLALSLSDAKNISRDTILILILFGPVAIFFLLRYLIPVATDYLQAEMAFDLTEHYLYIVCFMSLIPTQLFGFIFGLLILEERDEEIIAFIAVTPLQKTGYLTYKLLASTLMSFAFFFIVVYGTGLTTIPLKYASILALLVAFEAPIGSLFLAAYAENKVEGMAYSKILGLMYIAPVIVFFFDTNWHYFAAFLPPFWVAKAFIAAKADAQIFWIYIVLGTLVHAGIILFLLRKFLNNQR
ncbi:MAG: hypothetical protein DWQ05_07105 [Calditrichaeota bacterium]|nr:MAG: hypothetical protein DWQ05_07105 [Calditrichota bacterium]